MQDIINDYKDYMFNTISNIKAFKHCVDAKFLMYLFLKCQNFYLIRYYLLL